MTSFNPLDYPICLSQPRRLARSEWIEHIPFGMLLVDLLRPLVIVELGTYYGVSYCALCQAVKELGLDTRCFGIDTWRGDKHSGYFGPEVLLDLRKHHDPLYGTFSTLVRSTFREALRRIEDCSVDLLHIDGYHTYASVKSDFTCWLPRMSERGVVLLHDTHVRKRGFGVWKLWSELREKYPTLEFAHGHGLGVAAVGAESARLLEPFLAMSEQETASVRALFHRLGSSLSATMEMERLLKQNKKQTELLVPLQRSGLLALTRFFQTWASRGAGEAVGKASLRLRGRSGSPGRKPK